VSQGCLFGCQLLHAFKFKVLLSFYGGAGEIKWGFGSFDLLPMKGPPPTLESFSLPCNLLYLVFKWLNGMK